MKSNTDKSKKQKQKQKNIPSKTPLNTQTKKIQIKKVNIKKQDNLINHTNLNNSTKKQDSHPKKNLSTTNLTKTTNSGLSSGTQTSKHSQQQIKYIPKGILGQIKQFHSLKIFTSAHKSKLSEKSQKSQKNHEKFEKLSEKSQKLSEKQINYNNQRQRDNKQKSININHKIQKSSKIIIVDRAKQQIKKSLANVIKSYYPQKKTCLDISMTQCTKDATTQKQQKISISDFNFIQIIGEGGYGKVWKVQILKTRKQYAMKQMSKAAIIMKKSVDNVLNQRKILQKLKHSFIANIQYAFNDRDNLYLVMDLLSGGDLRFHIGRINKFTQQQTKFLIGCIITSVQYIHKMKIFHRDIKPQNLVFDEQGYLKLTDFGIARLDSPTQNLDASGTPGYMAPEVLCKQIHSYPVDYYAIGIITYELILGKRPYHGNNRIQIRDCILSKQHILKKSQLPSGYKSQVIDFVNKLILRQPNNRLGTKNGIKQLKSHPWFKGFDWDQLSQRKIKSPFKHKFNLEISQKIQSNEQSLMQFKLLQKSQQKIDPFAKYYFQSSTEK